MQNIVIPVSSPTVPAPTAAVAGKNSAPTKPFGDMLARQLADSAPPDETNATNAGLSITFTTDDILATPVTNEQPVELQVPKSDDASALPNNMLAALLPNNLAEQIAISRSQATQSDAASHNRTQSLTTGDLALSYDESATTTEMLNAGNNSKSKVILTEAQLTPEFASQLSAPQSNTTPLAAQQASVSNLANVNSPIPASINTPVANHAWADDFSQKIVWVTSQHGQSAELRLNPPQLGPLEVLIKVSGDQATAIFTSSHAVVRDAIEQAMPKLREMLADNGIMLGNATVSDQSPREQQTRQASQQQKREGGQAQMDQDTLGVSTQVRHGHHHQGSVDTFA